MSKKTDLEDLPGHYIRRLHQLAVALFSREVAELNLTPVQYSSLQAICNSPGIDQGTLARTIGFDTSTIGSVIDRLEARRLVDRKVSPDDRRVRLVTPTLEGIALLAAVLPSMFRSQTLLLAPLTEPEKAEFMRLVRILVNTNPVLGRVPTDAS